MGRHLSRGLIVVAVVLATACGLDVVGTATGDDEGGVPDATAPDVATEDVVPADVATDVATPCPAPMTQCGGTCVATATDRANCGGCNVACKATAACEGSCVAVADALAPFRYELPCSGTGSSDTTCAQPATIPNKTATLGGTSGHSYDVHIHVRGVVEQRTYADAKSAGAVGTNASFFITASSPGPLEAWNTYPLALSDPAVTYYVNSGMSNHQYVDGIDYTATIRVQAGATIQMQSQATDTNIIKNVDQNGTPIVVAGVPPAPAAFDGQFVQIDVDAVDPVP